MSDAPTQRTGRSGGIFVAVVVGGSAIAVVGWYLMTNRGGAQIDASGFDLSAAPVSRRPAYVPSSSPAPAGPVSSLSMMKGDAGVRIGDAGSAAAAQAPAGAASAAKPMDKKTEARMSFTEAARKHEGEVRAFAMRMTNKYPVIRQYGKDWMSYPDLKKLNDDYAANKDPIAFMLGLSRAPSFGTLLKKYAGAPEMRDAVMQGMKQAPPELTSSAMDVMQNDAVLKDLVVNVANGMGLPPSVTGMINGGGDPSKVDPNKITSDVMNNPEMRKAMQGQAPPVSLPNQQ
ncbi:MAG: hypothetical protein ACHQ51_00490 [Elusimicrobiota bacterium]